MSGLWVTTTREQWDVSRGLWHFLSCDQWSTSINNPGLSASSGCSQLYWAQLCRHWATTCTAVTQKKIIFMCVHKPEIWIHLYLIWVSSPRVDLWISDCPFLIAAYCEPYFMRVNHVENPLKYCGLIKSPHIVSDLSSKSTFLELTPYWKYYWG